MATISRRDVLSAGVTAIPLLGLAGAVSAQQPPRTTEGTGNPNTASAPGGMAAMTDAPLAACVLIKGKKQIEVCNFALPKIQDADVKAFAQDEINEHETLKKKLQGLGYDAPTPVGGVAPRGAGAQPGGDSRPGGSGAQPNTGTPGERGTTPPATTSPRAGGRDEGSAPTGTPPATRPGATGTQPGATGTQPGATGSQPGATGAQAGMGAAGVMVMVGKTPLPAGVSMLIDIDREVGEQCAATAKSELGKLEGVKFDKAFVGNQLHAHYDLLDHNVVFRKHSSPAMAPALDEARAVIEKHIATCKQLMEKLDASK